MSKSSLSRVGLSASVLLVSGHALASGFSTARFGGEHGNPITTNPTAIYYNPAGIAESQGIHIFLDGNLALRSASYTHAAAATDVPEPAGARGANVGEAKLFNVLASPMLGVTAKVGPFALGLGAYVPFGATSQWDKNERFAGNRTWPGPVDGVQRWHSIEGTISAMYATATMAVKIPRTGLSLGVSGNAVRSAVSLVRARTPTGDDDVRLEGRALIDVSGWQGSFGVGAMWEAVAKTLWFGASYQSRPNVSGGMRLGGTLKTSFGGAVNEQRVDLLQDLPDIVRFGVRLRASRLVELRLFGDWTRWSAFENQCVVPEGQDCAIGKDGAPTGGTTPILNQRRDWQDAFGVRAGVSLFPIPTLEVFAGAGYDSNAVPARTLEPALPDFHNVAAALGLRGGIGKRLFIQGQYTQLFYFSRDTAGESEFATLAPTSRGPDAGGRYEQWIGVINANVELVF